MSPRNRARLASAPTPRRLASPALQRRLVVAAVVALAGGSWALLRYSDRKASAHDLAVAEDLMAHGDPGQALSVLEDMRRRGLDPPERRVVLAVAYGKTNDPRALAAAKEATAAAPDSLRAHMALLTAYTRVYDKPHAMAELGVAERLAPPDNTELCLFGARYAASTHDYDAVADQARRCVAIDPRLAPAWYYLGLALGQSTGPAQWNEGATSLQKSVALAPDFYPAWLELGSVELQRGHDADAALSLERARATAGPLPPSVDAGTRQRLQDLIRIDHLLLKAYHRQGRTAQEAAMRRECDDLNERVQHLPAT